MGKSFWGVAVAALLMGGTPVERAQAAELLPANFQTTYVSMTGTINGNPFTYSTGTNRSTTFSFGFPYSTISFSPFSQIDTEYGNGFVGTSTSDHVTLTGGSQDTKSFLLFDEYYYGVAYLVQFGITIDEIANSSHLGFYDITSPVISNSNLSYQFINQSLITDLILRPNITISDTIFAIGPVPLPSSFGLFAVALLGVGLIGSLKRRVTPPQARIDHATALG